MYYNSMTSREREENGSQREPKGSQMGAKGVPEGKGSQRKPNWIQMEAQGSHRQALGAEWEPNGYQNEARDATKMLNHCTS